MTTGKPVRRIAIIGTGAIGASWTALFLAKGLEVIATDIAPDAEASLKRFVRTAWPALERLGLAPGASQSNFSFTADMPAAVRAADFVQENGPERIDFKKKLYRQLDELLPPDVIIASSSSGLTMSAIQSACRKHPERCVIGHPFNPPHLVPLVEIVGGTLTSEATIQRAIEFYSALGKQTVRLLKEVPGHVANRLQAALAREVYYLVAEDVVSVADVDKALSWGPGLRWGIMGNMMLNHLGGGPGGIEHFFDQFTGPMTAWWKVLGSPELTPAVRSKLIAGLHEEVGSRSIAELEAERDEVLLRLLEARREVEKAPAATKPAIAADYAEAEAEMADVVDDVRPRALRAGLPVPTGKPGRKRIVIVGGGFAGVAVARALRRCEADVLLVDRRNHHIFQPLLYQVATAVLAPSEIAAPLRQLTARQGNLDVLLGEATGVDLRLRTVSVSCPDGGVRAIPFDFLVVAAGMQPSYFGHDEFARYAPGLKTLADAEAIRAKILRAYERADAIDGAEERTRQMTFVLVGAGPTGVELAASLAQMAAVTLRRQYRRIDPAKSSIILIEGGPRILPSFAERLARKAARRLEKLGVTIMTGARVEKVDDGGVIVDGRRIASATVLWTAGVAPAPIVKLLGGQTDRAGRVSVSPFMDLQDVPGVFVIGDASSVVRNGRPVPGVAQAAIQQGRYVGRLIARQLKGRDRKHPFHYVDKGNMAVVGKNFAVLESGFLRTSGFVTWLVWIFLHLMSLPQLQNRMRVQTQWFWSYFTGQRSSRLIPELPRAQSARLESAERIVPVETTNIRARISDLIEPPAVQSDRKSL